MFSDTGSVQAIVESIGFGEFYYIDIEVRGTSIICGIIEDGHIRFIKELVIVFDPFW